MPAKKYWSEEERIAARRAKAREHYARNRERIIREVVEWKRRKKRADPNYKPRETLSPEEKKERGRIRRRLKYERALAEIGLESLRQQSRARYAKMRAANPLPPKKTPEQKREANRVGCRRYWAGHRDELLLKQRAAHHANREQENAKRAMHYYQHREENRPVRAKKAQDARQKSPLRFMYWSARERAKKKSVPFGLTLSDMESIWTGNCAVSGLPVSVGRGSGPKFFSASLDRIEPSRGYVADNVRIVMWSVNAMKGEGTDDDLLMVAKAIVDNFPNNNK